MKILYKITKKHKFKRINNLNSISKFLIHLIFRNAKIRDLSFPESNHVIFLT